MYSHSNSTHDGGVRELRRHPIPKQLVLDPIITPLANGLKRLSQPIRHPKELAHIPPLPPISLSKKNTYATAYAS